ncbi:MAG: hypothetical protein JWM27_3182 [Gemmatimonadetes bacterium]|nr:hypothetical protein [Gemmatimonadota bacterium]
MKHSVKILAVGLMLAGAAAVSRPAQAQGIGGRLRRAVQQRVEGQPRQDSAQTQPPPPQGQQGGSQPSSGGMGGLGGMMGQRMMAQYSQTIMNQIMPMVFAMAFHSGSYSFQEREYAPGEYTRWRMVGAGENADTAYLERAFLGKAADGSQWWHVAYVFKGSEKQDTLALEGQFSADRSHIIRMRGQMPGQPQPTEMPVQENTFGYMPPTMLTPQSLAGATLGTESVTVPAGTFRARHVRFGDMTGGSLDWWLDDSVPGGMVKYTVGGGQAGQTSVLELMQKGTGARSTLGVTIQ